MPPCRRHFSITLLADADFFFTAAAFDFLSFAGFASPAADAIALFSSDARFRRVYFLR